MGQHLNANESFDWQIRGSEILPLQFRLGVSLRSMRWKHLFNQEKLSPNEHTHRHSSTTLCKASLEDALVRHKWQSAPRLAPELQSYQSHNDIQHVKRETERMEKNGRGELTGSVLCFQSQVPGRDFLTWGVGGSGPFLQEGGGIGRKEEGACRTAQKETTR